jgi:tetratricopeptide (TPR) repeat protein
MAAFGQVLLFFNGPAMGETATSASLPPLPSAPSLTFRPPDPQEREQLNSVLSRIGSADPAERAAAVPEILEVLPSWLGAIHQRVHEIGDKCDRSAMKRVLLETRRKTRDRASQRETDEEPKARAPKSEQSTPPDYLAMLLEQARPSSAPWQDLTAIVAMSRMLAQIGTVEAARELIEVYVRFGEFLRVNTQLQLQKLGNGAVAALIEARRHQSEKIARWADRQLDILGKGIPGEAVQTDDMQALADVLRAYGRTRDPDAARLVISFSNSERSQIREAARQSVSMMGEVALWQLRDAYENALGKRPPRDWSWQRTARELFLLYDRIRLAQVYSEFDQGLKAQSAGNYAAMRSAFDTVLAESPLFERRSEMASGYYAYARQLEDKDPEAALAALRRAERLSSDASERDRISSRRLTLEAERLAKAGTLDQFLLRRAMELDSGNARARRGLDAALRAEATGVLSRQARWAAAIAIAVVALGALGFIGWKARRERGQPETV